MLEGDRSRLQQRVDDGERLSRGDRKYLRRLDTLADALAAAADRSARIGADPPRVLAFDPRAFGGDGRAVVSVGTDPHRAASVSWHVPGLTTNIESLHTNLDNALNHLESTLRENPELAAASIAWIGYDAPDGFPQSLRVLGHGLARAGGEILHADIAAFNAARDATAGDGSHFTDNHVFGHSYGSTTTSYGGRDGRLGGEARTITLLGSPGAGPHRTAADFNVGDQVFVASSSRDPVTGFGARSRGWFPWPGRAGWGLGVDPAMDVFGAPRVTSEFPSSFDTVGNVFTHTTYYDYIDAETGTRSESLANFGRIAAGHGDQVHPEPHRTSDDRSRLIPGWRTDEPAMGRPLRLDGDTGSQYPVTDPPRITHWHSGFEDAASHRGGEGAHDCLPRTSGNLADWHGRDFHVDTEVTPRGLPARELFEAIGSASQFSTFEQIAETLRQLGPGSSAAIASSWSAWHAEGGHAYAAVNDNGVIRLLDSDGRLTGWPPSWGGAVDRVAVGFLDLAGHPVSPLDGTAGQLDAADDIGDVGRRWLSLGDDRGGDPVVRVRPDLGSSEHGPVIQREFPPWTDHIMPDGAPADHPITADDVQHVPRQRIETDYPVGTHPEFPESTVREVDVVVGGNSAVFTVVDGVPVRADFTITEVFEDLKRHSVEAAAQRELGAATGYHAGHMLGFRFGLDQGLANMFEQVANFNTGAYKTMENEWAVFTEYGGEIAATVRLTGDPPSIRPDTVEVIYTAENADGDEVYLNRANFANNVQQSFVRLSRDEILRRLVPART